MRPLACLTACVALAACRAEPSRPAGRPADAAVRPASAAPPAAQARPPADPAPLRAIQQQLRRAHFRRQAPVIAPPMIGPTLRALVLPDTPTKVVAFEVKRRMAFGRVDATRRQEMLRYLTVLDHGPLVAALRARLVAEGWMAPNDPVGGQFSHPQKGVLSLQVTAQQEEATAVELTLQAPAAATPLEAPARFLSQPPPWRAAQGWPGEVVGYELSMFHATGKGVRRTDLERLAVALKTAKPEKVMADLEAKAARLGFKPMGQTPHAFRHADGRTLGIGPLPEGLLVVHQRRWARPGPPKVTRSPSPPAARPAPDPQR